MYTLFSIPYVPFCVFYSMYSIRFSIYKPFNLPSPSVLLTAPHVFCRVYWPMFVLIFYVLSPIPTFISRRLSDDSDSSSNACRELAYFLTTGIVVSSFGLPVVLARTSTVSPL